MLILRKLREQIASTTWLLLLLSATGCISDQTGWLSTGTDAAISSSQNFLKIKLRDFPLANSEISSIFIDLQRVEFLNSTSGQILTVNSTPQMVDLLSLVNHKTTLIGATLVPTGTYQQIRLILGQNNYLIANGVKQPLQLPSGTQTGIKLNGTFTLRGGRITWIQLDWDAQQSLGFNNGQGYMLKPVIQITSVVSLTSAQEQALVAALGPLSESAVEQADTIVQATTAGTLPAYSSAPNGAHIIVTEVSINVSDLLKGTSATTFNYEVLGGKIGNMAMFASHIPVFFPGETYLLLLKKYSTGIGTVGGDQGKIPL